MPGQDHEGAAPPPLRADARRNREKLLVAASRAFVEQGAGASLEEIARQAGVGIGTLYRHFPTREELIAVVYEREMEGVREAGEALEARLPPDEALAQWLQRCLDYMATKRGLGDSLRRLMEQRPDLIPKAQKSFPATLQRLVAAGVAAGRLRADASADDILHAMSGIYLAPQTPEWRQRSGRVLALLIDGLRRTA